MEVGEDEAQAAGPEEEEHAWVLCGRRHPGSPSGTTWMCGVRGPGSHPPGGAGGPSLGARACEYGSRSVPGLVGVFTTRVCVRAVVVVLGN